MHDTYWRKLIDFDAYCIIPYLTLWKDFLLLSYKSCKHCNNFSHRDFFFFVKRVKEGHLSREKVSLFNLIFRQFIYYVKTPICNEFCNTGWVWRSRNKCTFGKASPIFCCKDDFKVWEFFFVKTKWTRAKHTSQIGDLVRSNFL